MKLSCSRSNKKYNVVTLKPYDKEEQQKFWKYRCEDVDQMLALCCWVYAAYCLSFVALAIQKRNKVTYVKFGYKLAIELLTILMWLVIKRFKSLRVFSLLFLYAGIEAIFVIQGYHVSTFHKGDDPS